MKWIHLFSSFDGRIGRKSFWLLSIAIVAVEIVVIFIAAAGALTLSIDVRWIDIVIIAFVYPKLVIDVKRGHDRNIPLWVLGIFYLAVIVREGLVDFGWLVILPNQNVFSSVNLASFIVTMLLAVVGLAFLVELGFRRGTPGPNRFGPDPLGAQTLPAQS